MSIELARAIAKGKSKELKKCGLRETNVNESLCPGLVLKVKAVSGECFVETIEEPTPLIYAILNERLDVVLTLVNHFHASFAQELNGILFNILRIAPSEISRTCDTDGSTPLQIAVTNRHIEAAMILLKLGANIAERNNDGNSALHMCARMGDVHMAQLLIAGGAKIHQKNAKKQTAQDIAELSGNQKIIDYFKAIQTKTKKPETLDSLLKSSRYKNLGFLLEERESESESESESEDIVLPKPKTVEKKKESKKLSHLREQLEETQEQIESLQAQGIDVSKLTGILRGLEEKAAELYAQQKS